MLAPPMPERILDSIRHEKNVGDPWLARADHERAMPVLCFFLALNCNNKQYFNNNPLSLAKKLLVRFKKKKGNTN